MLRATSIDDFSYVRRDQAESSVLLELIAERYEHKSIAITANQPFSAWDQLFPEAAMTVAAIDRLVHHLTIFETNVESYRRKTATARIKPGEQARNSPRRQKDHPPLHRPGLLSLLVRIVDARHGFLPVERDRGFRELDR
jgi:hypothetical protein